MHENMNINNAYEECFTEWMDLDFVENATFDDLPLSDLKEIPWLQTALKQGWVEACAWIQDLEDVEVNSETYVRITFDMDEICDNLHLLDQEKWDHEIQMMKQRGWQFTDLPCTRHVLCTEHNWVPNPREMNEHTTYSCTDCDSHRGCA